MLILGKIRNYYTFASDHNTPSFITRGHLGRRIAFSLSYNEETNEYVEYEYDFLNSAIESINYIRAYCKYRRLFLKKVVFLEETDIPQILSKFPQGNDLVRIINKTDKTIEIEFLNDDAVIGSD